MDKFLTSEGATILYNDLKNSVVRIDNELRPQMTQKIDGAFVSEDGKYLHLTANGIDFIGPLGPFSGGSGGGGGGSDNNAKLTVQNMTSWGRTVSLATSSECIIQVYWDSIEDEEPTGNGAITVRNGADVIKTGNIAQGMVTLNVTDSLKMGTNTIYVSISDVYGNTRTLTFSVTVTAFALSSTVDSSLAYSGNINFAYTATGDASKMMNFILDDELIGTKEVISSGRSETFVISPAMWKTHGVHKFQAYFTAEVNGSPITSNVLSYEFMCAEPENVTPMIASTFTGTTVQQYEILEIPFIIYNPASQVSTLTMTVNGQSETRENVPGNTWQTWTYRVMGKEALEMTITLGTVSRTFSLTVDGSIIPISAIDDDSLSLYLTSSGRSNFDSNREVWAFNDIQAQFSGFTWTSDGWLPDDDGYTSLLVKGDGRVTIPYQLFKEDFRPTGKTIEVEFSTSDVNDYTAPVISCVSGKVGLAITAQDMTLSSAQTTLETQFKEDEHVRITFVVDSSTTDRLILCYINSILSGVTQYPVDDDFEQTSPVDITIGSNDVTTHIYNIRIYDRALSRFDVLKNWICDKQNAEDMLAAYEHNNVFDAAESQILMEKLPADLPYLVMFPQRTDGTHTLPQSKSDKIPCSGYYIDPQDSSKNFTFVEAEAAVQGTSSAIYPRKNYKIKFKKDKDPLKRPNFSWTQTETGAAIKSWAMNDQAIPTNTFTFKADFASSEGANNVELVRLYNDLVKTVYRTPPQTVSDSDTEEDKAYKEKVRVGIDGFPILMFYNNGTTTTFLGKYNFNNDKGTAEVYGFEDDDESWEITSNVSELANWQSDNLSPESNPLKWTEAFENRHPDTGDDADITKLQALSTWLVSTARGTKHEQVKDPVTGDEILIDTGVPVWADPDKTEDPDSESPIYHGVDLPEPVTYQVPQYNEDGAIYGYKDITYTEDNADYRLAKYRAELEEHCNLTSALFYYLFTELFLLVDSRAKNAFPTIFDKEGKWCWIPYDMDTAIGINNEGKLTFGYSLEDIDQVDGADVYNGQYSTMWCNLRDAFPRELRSLYQELVSNGLTYENIESRFEEHQAKWPEAVFNEDAYFKYIEPFLTDNAPYLEMCLGSKAEQRKWWLYNRFRYIDSKYVTGEAEKAQIKFRAYSNGPLNIVPYADIYARFRMGGKNESPAASARAFKNQVTTLTVNPGDNVNDLDCYIFSADQLKDVGDMSVFTPDTCDFSAAIKLQKLKIGRATPNPNLKSLTLGSNVLLKSLNVINCPNLPSLDASSCTNLEELYLEGCTSLTSATLPTGGMMTTLHLPANITNLTIKNQTRITDLVLEGTSEVQTLVFENVSPVIEERTLSILEGLPDGARVRLWNFEESFASIAELKEFISTLDRMRGINGNNGNEPVAQVLGTVTVTSDEELDYEYYAAVRAITRYPNLEINCRLKKTVKFYNWDDTLLDTRTVTTYTGTEGSVTYLGVTPVHNDSDTIHYVWRGWATSKTSEPVEDILDHIDKSYNLYAYFEEIPIYTVRFYDYDGTTLLDTQTTRPDLGSYVDYTQETPTAPSGFTAPFLGWGTAAYAGVDIVSDGTRISDITESMDLIAQMDWEIKAESIQVSGDFKTHYFAAETFSPAGMVVQVQKLTPAGEQTSAVIGYSYTTSKLTKETTAIEVQVDDHNIAQIPVYIAQSMAVTKDPDKYFQYTDQELDLTGMEVSIYYPDDLAVVDSDLTKLTYLIDGVDPTVPQVISVEGYASLTLYYQYGGLTCPYEVLALTQVHDVLEENTWPAISAVVNANRVPNTWHIGDTKSVLVQISGGWRGVYTFRILAFDHNLAIETPVDPETGEPLYSHSITFGVAQLEHLYNPEITDMREVALGEAIATGVDRFDPDNPDAEYHGWETSWHYGNGLTEFCDLIYQGLPDELRKLIKPVIKYQSDTSQLSPYDDSDSAGFYYGEMQHQQNYVYIPSFYELTGLNNMPANSKDQREALGILESEFCRQFPYYRDIATTPASRIKYQASSVDKTPRPYWTRSWMYTWKISSTTIYYMYAGITSAGIPAADPNAGGLGANDCGILACFTL